MNTEKRISEWIKETLERPISSDLIIQTLGTRLIELETITEQLRSENLALRNGSKVGEYEDRLQNMEYQLELLKRQVQNNSIPLSTPETFPSEPSVLFYTEKGRILHLTVEKISNSALPLLADNNFQVVITNPKQEILCLYSSGRIATVPVQSIEQPDTIPNHWDAMYIQEPRAGEKLTALIPIGRIALYEYCVQISRRGAVKRMKRASVENYIRSQFIGTGARQTGDQAFQIALCNEADRLLLISHEGFLFNLPVQQLPYTIEEVIRLNNTDHIIAGFALKENCDFFALTQTGKALHRQYNWLEPAESFKSQGQSILSPSRRVSGIRIIASGPAQDGDWGIACDLAGRLHRFETTRVLNSGSIEGVQEDFPLVACALFTP